MAKSAFRSGRSLRFDLAQTNGAFWVCEKRCEMGEKVVKTRLAAPRRNGMTLRSHLASLLKKFYNEIGILFMLDDPRKVMQSIPMN